MSNTQEKTQWFTRRKPVRDGVYETAGAIHAGARIFYRKWIGTAWSKCCRTIEEARKQTRAGWDGTPRFWRGFTTKQD